MGDTLKVDTPSLSPSHARSHSAGQIPVTSFSSMANAHSLAPPLHESQNATVKIGDLSALLGRKTTLESNNTNKMADSSSDSRTESTDQTDSRSSRKVMFGNLSTLTTQVTEHNTLVSEYAGSLAFRPFMSFTRLVSGHTLGEDDEPKGITSESEVSLTFNNQYTNVDKGSRKIKLPSSRSCNSSPRETADQSDSLSMSHSLNQTVTKSKSLDQTERKNRSKSGSRITKHSRIGSKEIDHWLEYQKKYGTVPNKSNGQDESLKDITNVHLRVGSLSESTSVENTPRSDASQQSSLFANHAIQNGEAGSHVSGVTHWSCNMNAVIKRKQELDEEIRSIEKLYISPRTHNSHTADENYDSDLVESRRHNGVESDSVSGPSHPHSSGVADTNEPAGDVTAHNETNLKTENLACDREEPIANTRELRRDTSPRFIITNSKPPSVMGKPPVPPKKSHAISLREVSEDHFPTGFPKHVDNRTSNDRLPLNAKKTGLMSLPSDQHLSKSWDGGSMVGESRKAEQQNEDSLREHVLNSVKCGTRKKNGRRSMSDLGFNGDSKLKMSRTAALLRNPAMRKHFASSMGLSHNAPEEEIQDVLNEKLESIISGSSRLERRSSSTLSLCTFTSPVNDLHRSASLSGGLNESASDNLCAESEAARRSLEPPQDANTQANNSADQLSDGSEKDNLNSRVSSKFQIPSFKEFRKRHKLEKKRPVAASFELSIEEPIKEEPELCDLQGEGQRSDSFCGTRSRVQGKDDVQNNNSAKFIDSSDAKNQYSSKNPSTSETSENSSHQFSEKYCDCTASESAKNSSFCDNPNTSRCSKCCRIRRVYMTGLGTLPFDSQEKTQENVSSGFDQVFTKASHRSEKTENKSTPHNKKWRNKMVLETEGSVNRSVSDVSDICAEEERKKGTREKRQKIYKSDPFAKVTAGSQHVMKACSEGVEIENELLSLIQDAKSSSAHSLESTATQSSVQSVDSCLGETSSDEPPKPPPRKKRSRSRKKKKKRKDHSGRCDIERADSGVGLHSANSTQKDLVCVDCEESLGIVDALDSPVKLCQDCLDRREERKRTILEIVHTEESYGKDLKIMFEEFYRPMKCNGLLNQEQLDTIFLNLEELISINEHFVSQLKNVVDSAIEQGDEDLSSVAIGRLFLETTNMLLAFETYCIDQSDATLLLEQLEKERELLKIFLEVSQAENSALRRMHLKAFLVVPVQRIMKYPLLLNRIYKKTRDKNEDRVKIKEALHKIEEILEHINFKTKGTSSMRGKRKFFMQQLLRKASDGLHEDIEIYKIAIESLGWSKNDVSIVYSGKLLYTTMPDMNSTKRGKPVKYITVHGVLVTHGKGAIWDADTTSQMWFPRKSAVKQCALVLLKEKLGRFSVQREPFLLEKCVVSMDSELPEIFEIHEMSPSNECYLFKSEDHKETTIWYNHLKFQGKDLGKWRHRRNALPHIMIALGK